MDFIKWFYGKVNCSNRPTLYLLYRSYKEGKVRYSLPRSCQWWRDLPRDNPLVSVEVLRYRPIVRIGGQSLEPAAMMLLRI
nr:hypothetical protein [Tanacetum cinerariifolium]